jgi:hypothetical protein
MREGRGSNEELYIVSCSVPLLAFHMIGELSDLVSAGNALLEKTLIGHYRAAP